MATWYGHPCHLPGQPQQHLSQYNIRDENWSQQLTTVPRRSCHKNQQQFHPHNPQETHTYQQISYMPITNKLNRS